MNTKFTDETVLKSGAHQGKKLANVPASYLLFMWNNTFKGKLDEKSPLCVYIHDNLDVIKSENGSNNKK